MKQIVALRLDREMSQSAFWVPLGVTQSGASRYEAGRPLPRPVRLLVEHLYFGVPLPKP